MPAKVLNERGENRFDRNYGLYLDEFDEQCTPTRATDVIAQPDFAATIR